MTALVPVADTQHGARGFLAWWAAELRGLLPARFRQRQAPRRSLLVTLDGGVARVRRRRGPRVVPVATVDLAAAAGGDASALRRVARSREPLWLLLAPGDGIIAVDTLPREAEREIETIMQHRIEVLTPWPPGSVYADARVRGRRGDGLLDVALAVAARRAVDEKRAALAAHGIEVAGVDLADGPGNLPAGFDLLRGRGTRRAGRTRRLLLLALLVLGIGTTVAVGGLELWTARRALEDKRRYVAALEERFAEIGGLRERVAAKRQEASFVAERRRAAVSAAVVLETLSRILPDQVWLTELQLEGEELNIAGYAIDAARVLPIIEASPHFSRTRYRAPSTRTTLRSAEGAETSVERFALAATVAPRMDPAP